MDHLVLRLCVYLLHLGYWATEERAQMWRTHVHTAIHGLPLSHQHELIFLLLFLLLFR